MISWGADGVPMLTIRSAQMEAFQAHRRRNLEEAAVAHMLSRTGDDALAVRETVRAGIQQAWSIGFRHESEILRWLRLIPVLDADAGRKAWVTAILADRELTPALKLTLLEDASA